MNKLILTHRFYASQVALFLVFHVDFYSDLVQEVGIFSNFYFLSLRKFKAVLFEAGGIPFFMISLVLLINDEDFAVK